jgi:asparagine synthase (glutamine-hydrolysing)
MCGIAAFFGSGELNDAGLLQSLWHRGPDARGSWSAALPFETRIQLLHTRLKILDLTEAAAQPMILRRSGQEGASGKGQGASVHAGEGERAGEALRQAQGAADAAENATAGEYVLVCNGEIYNFRELRADLAARGHTFRSTGDTEVLLHAYAEWGEEAFARLDGMFAVAIFDGPRRRLVLARDHAGIKPLYLTRLRDGGLLIASEVRALVGSGRCETTLDPAGVEAYLRTGSCEEPRTLYTGIRAFPAGHYVSIPLDRGLARAEVFPIPFWLPEQIPVAAAVSFSHWSEEHQAILAATVRDQLAADVPIGVFLSGGIDSALLTEIAAGQSARDRITAFTLGGPATEHDEVAAAAALAKRAGVRHAAVVLRNEELDRWVWEGLAAMDQPSADGLNLYLVSRASRQAGLVVALSGTGADELHGAYGHPRRLGRMQRLVAGCGPLRGAVRTIGAMAVRAGRGEVAADRWRGLWDATPSAGGMLAETRRYFTARQIAAMNPNLDRLRLPPAPPCADAEAFARLEFAEQVRMAEICGYLRNTLLRDGDGATMANHQELRVPFLGRRYMEHILRAPEAVTAKAAWRNKPRLIALLSAESRALATQPKRGFVLNHVQLLDRTMREPFVAAAETLGTVASFRIDAVAWLKELERTRSQKVARRLWALLALGAHLSSGPRRTPAATRP